MKFHIWNNRHFMRKHLKEMVLNLPTHTHAHTQREREREKGGREREIVIKFVRLYSL